MSADGTTSAPFSNPLTARIAAFLREIGLGIRIGAIAEATALPGIDIDRATIVVDEERLLYPGDLLHEAGHLAVAEPERRAAFHHDVGNDPAEEMMAIAWSWAAALHLRIDPALVFHEAGYRGGSRAILDAFGAGYYIGVPVLDFVGMAIDPKRAKRQGIVGDCYPHMLRWLRDA